MRIKLANILLIAGLSVLLFGEALFGFRMYTHAKEQQQIKQDYSLVHNITFGIFSVDEWRERVSAILNGQVNDYHITPEQKRQMLVAIEKKLHSVVGTAIAGIDKPQKSLLGKLKKIGFHAFTDSASLQAQVRPFAKIIVQKISSPRSQARLKGIAAGKIGELESQTYDNTYESYQKITKNLFQKYHAADKGSFDKKIHDTTGTVHTSIIKDAAAMLGCVLLALALWALMRKQVQLQATLLAMSLLFAAVLLIVGITCPIIDVDARMRSFNFVLLGQNVTFQNQVLFFQSKSISGIITTLISQQKPDAVTVGILILLFVVLLPFIRLIAKGFRVFTEKSKVVNYLALEANKWDMADVVIIGVLMTYIGLNGILESQLANLNIHNDVLTTTTVNYTSMQSGFYIFAAYVVFELVLSYIMKRRVGAVKPKRYYSRRMAATDKKGEQG